MKTDFTALLGLPLRTGSGFWSITSCRNLLSCPVGARVVKAVTTWSTSGKTSLMESGLRADPNRTCARQERQAPTEFQFVSLPSSLVALAEVPFIHEQETGTALLQGEAGDFGVLLGDPFHRIEKQQSDIGSSHRTHRPT